MAYTGSGYKIWLNRKDTHGRIINEDIWVGNIPNDGYSKITSGYSESNPDMAYVLFPTWEDLLKAIGEEETTVQVHVTGRFDQIDEGGGGGGTENVTVTGTFDQTE